MRRHRLRQSPTFIGVHSKCFRVGHDTHRVCKSVMPTFMHIIGSACMASRAAMRKQIGIWCVVVLGMRVGCGEHVVSRSLHRYKELAAECVNVAQQTSSARDKAVLLQMAEIGRAHV